LLCDLRKPHPILFNLLNENHLTAADSCCVLRACTETVRNATIPLWLYVLDMIALNKTNQSKTIKKFKKPLSDLARTDFIAKLKLSCKQNLTVLGTSLRRLGDP